MILTAGLTPAGQQVLCLDRLCRGQVNRAREVHWCASGKVLNVVLALHSLGAPVKALAVLGGQTGQAIRDEFQRCGVAARWVGSHVSTRVCSTLIDASQQAITEVVENAAPISTPVPESQAMPSHRRRGLPRP